MRVLLEAYGCTLNRGEAEELKEALISNHQTIVQAEEEYDSAIIFTCGVIETTQNKMLKRISELAGSGKKTMVCGCLGAICPDEIMKVAPEAHTYLPAELTKVLDDLRGIPGKIAPPTTERPSPTDRIGILPIATGCFGNCAYCVTKFARGRLISRLPEDVKTRAEELVKRGAVELQVTAQDTGIYGQDLGTDLTHLLDQITQLEGNFMVRVGMMNPNTAKEQLNRLLTAFESPKIFKFLHIPAQSGDDEILKEMGRKYQISDFINTVKQFRTRFPDLMLSTDIITGFPGETEEQFDRSLELIEDVKPDIVNVTRFSPRPGTMAATMNDQVHGSISKNRSRKMTDLRFKTSREKYECMIGKELEALATEYRKPGTTFLRTGNYRPVVVEEELQLSKWYDVKITGCEPTHLVAEVNMFK